MNINKLIYILLFPGIILHELAHIFACLFLMVPIKKVKLFSTSGGYVVHEDQRSYKTIIISLFPFIFNIAISIICGIYSIRYIDNIYKIILIWIGISSLFFCIPSSQDTNNVLFSIKIAYTKKQSIWKWLYKIIILPITLSIIILAILFKIFDRFFLFRILFIGIWIYIFIFII